MAMNAKPRSGRWWSRLHFLVRFLGLTGLLAAGVGLLLVWLPLENRFTSWATAWQTVQDKARALVTSSGMPLAERVALGLLAGGVVAVVFALLVELLVIVTLVTGRRNAAGFNWTVQIGLAAALLVGVNVFSFQHPRWWDWTREPKRHTLSDTVRQEMGLLKDPTTVVVYWRHKSTGQEGGKGAEAQYQNAAERKVVERVRDLVEQFRRLGPSLRVRVLDVEEEGYEDKLKKVTTISERGKADREWKELRAAIDGAPENTIFFFTNVETDQDKQRIQRLSFNELYQLDKGESMKANGGKGNLVLLDQGVQPFSRRVLNVDEKRPKVGVLVIHELLTTRGPEEYGMSGLAKVLTANGFDVKDVVLQRWGDFGPPTPAVLTYDENRFEQLEGDLASLNEDIKDLEDNIKGLTEVINLWKNSSLEDLNKRYAKELPRGVKLDEDDRRRNLNRFESQLVIFQAVLRQNKEERDEVIHVKAGLNVEGLTEKRRITDLKAKLERELADCDLIIVPRMTIRNVVTGFYIPNRLHRLDRAQIDAIKDFLKAGKPMLACFGPINEPAERRDPRDMLGGPDDLEQLLEQLGFRFGRQTVLFNKERGALTERRAGILSGGGVVDLPPVDFNWDPEKVNPLGTILTGSKGKRRQNPIRESMGIVSQSLNQNLELKLRHPRPIYYDPERAKNLTYEPEFMLTSPESWNDEQPFPSRTRVPRLEAMKPDDPRKGTLDEIRSGPFPIGVAVETQVPASWLSGNTAPPPIRVAVIGQGEAFVGSELSPVREHLLLNTCNWLLGREDLMPKAERRLEYPRVELSHPLLAMPQADADKPAIAMVEQNLFLWRWGTQLLLPLVFAYLGVVVVLRRRLR